MTMAIRLGKLHAAQQEIIAGPERFKVLACGRRFGKTTIAIEIICNRLLDGESTAYFAPTYKMTNEVWREIKERVYPVTKMVREHELRLETHTGGLFECWSLANIAAETVRGRKYHYVIVDEAALFESGNVWHSAIRPLLTDYKGGALFASTPRGRNWFWQLYMQGVSTDFPDWQSWRYPTTANPVIDPEEVEAARRGGMLERYYKQEYLAEFLEDGGVVFRNVDAVCVGEAQSDSEGETTVFGVDWGRDNDYTCISVMTRGGRQLYLERFNHIGWAVQRGRLAALYQRFRPSAIIVEENSVGSVNLEALQQEDLPVRGFLTTAKSKGPLIEELVLAMEKGEVTLLNDPVLKHELMAYEVERTAYGWSYSAPPGGHDDTVMATALSYWASKRYGGIGYMFA